MELDLTFPDVIIKYKTVAEIVNSNRPFNWWYLSADPKLIRLSIYARKATPSESMQTGNVYKNVKREIERGVAFPTCISINNTVCHFSPLGNDKTILEEKDIVKIDMGCHIDGFIVVVARTDVIQEGPVTGRVVDVIAAANYYSRSCLVLCESKEKRCLYI
ncbi:ERBB-3 BINDING PROTEIN 1-like [Zingiber officinale]|uniref:ERBB-3 BINDING PROTEIN 1-like n=1 Tax=Zingiber officinale TaxID=94328 RepID=UPI001C4AF180|nr:ERBB-3 BINDING PROTEIN 1-like [Zingiber officinale]